MALQASKTPPGCDSVAQCGTPLLLVYLCFHQRGFHYRGYGTQHMKQRVVRATG